MAEFSEGAGYAFQGAKARSLMVRLAPHQAENARRIPCLLCGLAILPETMMTHVEICHDDED